MPVEKITSFDRKRVENYRAWRMMVNLLRQAAVKRDEN